MLFEGFTPLYAGSIGLALTVLSMIGISMPVVKHSFMIQHPQEIPRAIHEAFHIARTGRPGPVLIDVVIPKEEAVMPMIPPGGAMSEMLFA